MLQRKRTLWTACLLSLFFFSTSAQAIDVNEVKITADNAYSFGWGDVNGIPNNSFHWFGNVYKSGSPIFTADNYFTNNPISVTVDDYFYIITVSDSRVTQGVMAEVYAQAPGKNLVSGQSGWEVYATGVTVKPQNSSQVNLPTLQDINKEIQKANNANNPFATTSIGWVNENGQVVNGSHNPVSVMGDPGKLEIGPDNNAAGGIFPLPVKGMNLATKWMWYNPSPSNISATQAFYYHHNQGEKEFLIFRLPAKKIIGDCCTECCTNFKYDFDDNVHFKVDEKTGQGLFFQTFHAKALGGLKQVSASIVSSSAVSCNGTESSLGLHFESPTPVTGWTDKLTHPPFSHEATWCWKKTKNTKNATFSLTQPLALTIPVSELKCAQTVKFCIKYTFINMRCQACEVIKCYEFSYSELMGGLPRLAQGKGQPTVAAPQPVRSPVITPIKVKTPVRRPMELRPTIRPLTPRPDPRPAPRPPVTTRPMNERPPVKVRPVDPRPRPVRPLPVKPQDQVKPVDPKKDPRKPVVEQPAEGKEAPRKSDREKPATKKPAERKEVEAKRDDDAPANRSVLLKK